MPQQKIDFTECWSLIVDLAAEGFFDKLDFAILREMRKQSDCGYVLLGKRLSASSKTIESRVGRIRKVLTA